MRMIRLLWKFRPIVRINYNMSTTLRLLKQGFVTGSLKQTLFMESCVPQALEAWMGTRLKKQYCL
ncbi:hypothetical protein CEJ86_33670 [Sinorhizobium meliloti]|uniref:Uncharacterized protein n=1 Tax=Rhizobium meliloti TaxID=382 RepID=A0A2J0YSW5_RHIML|nr:hypothetical protein CEJ86_33670 [Sinorhizobium meliloti]